MERTLRALLAFEGNGNQSFTFVVVPGLVASWTLPFGNGFFIRPELAANIPLGTSLPLGDGSLAMIAVAVGYEFRLD